VTIVTAVPAPRRGRTIDELLADSRATLRRLTPRQAEVARQAGGVLVDIRPEAQRRAEGALPTALVIERNVLEWRFDPACEASLPIADHDLLVIVICSEGYTSSLAAAALQALGVHRATDVIGGFHAWKAAGLPFTQAG
jgi:rhodanese-related sulfurtransferase